MAPLSASPWMIADDRSLWISITAVLILFTIAITLALFLLNCICCEKTKEENAGQVPTKFTQPEPMRPVETNPMQRNLMPPDDGEKKPPIPFSADRSPPRPPPPIPIPSPNRATSAPPPSPSPPVPPPPVPRSAPVKKTKKAIKRIPVHWVSTSKMLVKVVDEPAKKTSETGGAIGTSIKTPPRAGGSVKSAKSTSDNANRKMPTTPAPPATSVLVEKQSPSLLAKKEAYRAQLERERQYRHTVRNKKLRSPHMTTPTTPTVDKEKNGKMAPAPPRAPLMRHDWIVAQTVRAPVRPRDPSTTLIIPKNFDTTGTLYVPSQMEPSRGAPAHHVDGSNEAGGSSSDFSNRLAAPPKETKEEASKSGNVNRQRSKSTTNNNYKEDTQSFYIR